MFVRINIKQAGRKHAILEKQEIEIDDIGANLTVKDLVKAVVKTYVYDHVRATVHERLKATLLL